MSDVAYLDFVLLTAIGTLELLLGIYFLAQYRKDIPGVIFGSVIFCIAAWLLSNGIPLLFVGKEFYDFFTRLSFIFAIFIFALLDLYIYFFPYAEERHPGKVITRIFIAPVLLSLIILFSDAMIEGFRLDKYGTTIYGPIFWIYVIYVIFMFFLILGELFVKRKKVGGIHKEVINYLLVGIVLSGAISIIVVLLLPYYFGVPTTFMTTLGFASSLIWSGLVASVILKK